MNLADPPRDTLRTVFTDRARFDPIADIGDGSAARDLLEVDRMAKLLAVVVLAIGLIAFRAAFLVVSGSGAGLAGLEALSAAYLVVLLAGGIGSVLAALALFSHAPRTDARSQPTRLFGRGATPLPAAPSRAGAFLWLAPLVVIAALVGHRMTSLPAVEEGPVEFAPGVEAPPQPAPPAEDVVQVPPAEPQPPAQDVAVAPPPASPPVGDDGLPPLAPPAELAVPPVVEPPAQDVAVAPAEPAPPPQTNAPLPEPEPLPTQPDGHRHSVVWLSVSPDGKSILSASTDNDIKLWDIDGRRLIRKVGAHKDMARTALFLPDGKSVLTSGDDGEVVLRNLADGAVLHVFSAVEHGRANKVGLSADGKRAVSVHSRGTVIAWDIEKKTVLKVFPGHAWTGSGVAVSDDGKRAISGSIDGELCLWDLDALKSIRCWAGHDRGLYGAVFLPGSHYVMTGSGDYTIKAWNGDTGTAEGTVTGHSGTVYALAISRDGKKLLSGSLDGTARLWDVASGREILSLTGHSGPVYAVVFGPDDTLITGGNDRTIRIWRETGGEQLALFPGAPD